MYLYQPSNRDRSSPWNFYFDPNEDKEVSPGIVTLSKGTLSIATPSGATPSRATPSRATPSGATPSVATPSGATPSGATPSGVTPDPVELNELCKLSDEQKEEFLAELEQMLLILKTEDTNK
jgi:hypothetical protein